MFKNFHSKIAFAVLTAAGALLCASCDDKGTETPPDDVKTPRVELARGVATTTSLTFVASSWDAEKCAYTVIPADAEMPSAEAILQGGGSLIRIRA